MVAAVVGGRVGEGQLFGAGDNDGESLEEALGVAVQPDDRFPAEPGHKPLQGGAPALSGLHGPGLGPVFVHAQHDQAVGQFGVDLGRRGGHEQRDGAFHPVAAGA